MKSENPQHVADLELFNCLRFSTPDRIFIHGDAQKWFVLVHQNFKKNIPDFLALAVNQGRLIHRTVPISSSSYATQEHSETVHLYCLKANPDQIMVGIEETSGWALQFDGAGIIGGHDHEPRSVSGSSSQYYLHGGLFRLNNIQIMRWEYPIFGAFGKPKLKPITKNCYWE